MQLAFDAADRLVELVQARHGPVPAEDAAQALYALRHVPVGLARSLLDDVVAGDARLAWRGACVGLADTPGTALPLIDATYVVFDLETTGLSPGSAAICEIGAVRVRGLELGERFETLVNPRRPLPAPIAALTGIDPRSLRGAPPVELADAVLKSAYTFATSIAHNNGDGSFTLTPLPDEAQLAPVYGILATDVDRDGHTDLLLAGNFDGFKPEMGRMSASYGLLLRGDGKGAFAPVGAPESGFFVPGQSRDIQRVRTASGELIIVARNDDRPLIFRSTRPARLATR